MNEKILILDNWYYAVRMQPGFDSWQLTGIILGEHPSIPAGQRAYVSTPKYFDKDKMIVTTSSGRRYQLMNCDGNLQQQIEYIEEDVKRVLESKDN